MIWCHTFFNQFTNKRTKRKVDNDTKQTFIKRESFGNEYSNSYFQTQILNNVTFPIKVTSVRGNLFYFININNRMKDSALKKRRHLNVTQ